MCASTSPVSDLWPAYTAESGRIHFEARSLRGSPAQVNAPCPRFLQQIPTAGTSKCYNRQSASTKFTPNLSPAINRA
jgi:hypothetical protein